MCIKYTKLNAISIPVPPILSYFIYLLLKTPFDTVTHKGGWGWGQGAVMMMIEDLHGGGKGRDQTNHFSYDVICEHIHLVLTRFVVVHMGEWETAEHH